MQCQSPKHLNIRVERIAPITRIEQRKTPAIYPAGALNFLPYSAQEFYCFGCSAGTAGAAGVAGVVCTGGIASVPAGATEAGVMSPPCWAAAPGMGSVGLNLFGEKLGLIS